MLRPITPLISYYLDYDYIVSVLCKNKDKPKLECNGKCHLAKEIKKINKGIDPNQKAPPLNMKDYPIAPICLNTTSLIKYPFIKKNEVIDAYTENFNNIYLNFIFQPPELFS